MDLQSITVRPATPPDGPAMGITHVLAWQVGYRGILPDSHLDGLDAEDRGRFWTDHLQQQLAAPSADPNAPTTLVAEVDGDVLGMTSFGLYRTDTPTVDDADLCELWSLNVHPDAWGTGVAQALMVQIIDQLRANRPEPIAALWVLEDNVRGRRFYEKERWTPDGQSKSETFADSTITEVRYVRPL